MSSFAGRALHFVGVGGAGMSGLAVVTKALGATVTGSDRAESPYCERLRESGVEPCIGHAAQHVPEDAEIVVSTAIADDNPEVAVARARGQRVVHRGDVLGEVTALRRTIAISGSHGKTTTSAMAAHALAVGGHDPSYLVGAEVRIPTGPGGAAPRSNARLGGGEWIVVEADESDRSFLKLAREVAVVTNIELDHHSTYGSLHDLEEAFADFAAPAPSRIAWAGAPLPARAGQALRYGINQGELSAEGLELRPGGAGFEVEGVRVELAVPGRHNVLNALAALAACREAGLDLAEGASALASFTGAARRFERRGTTASGAQVFDDYAHHPTEVRATLEAARTMGAGRVVACFQPHLYSRTRHLARDFGRALALADVAVVLDVYPAREHAEDFPGVSGWLVATAAADAARGRRVYWMPGFDDAQQLLERELREGDVVLTLGAGDVDSLAGRLVAP